MSGLSRGVARTAACAALLAAALVVPPAAGAATAPPTGSRVGESVAAAAAGLPLTFTDPTTVSAFDRSTAFPQLGYDGAGALTAVWMQDDVISDSASDWRLQTATRTAGAAGTWTAGSSPISPNGAWAPSLAVGGNGAAVAVWKRCEGPITACSDPIEGAYRPSASAAWKPLGQVSPPKDTSNDTTAALLGPNGTGMLAWGTNGAYGFGDTYFAVKARSVNANDGSMGTVAEIAPAPPYGIAPTPAMASADGSAASTWFAWTGWNAPSATGVHQGRWVEPGLVDVTTVAPDGSRAAIAVDPAGVPVVAYLNTNEGSARVATGNGTSVRLSPTSGSAFRLSVAAGPGGRAVAIWVQDKPNGACCDRIMAAVRPSTSGAWGAAQALSEDGDKAQSPTVVIASDGTAFAAWTRSAGSVTRLQYAALPPTATTWGDAVSLAPTEPGDASNPTLVAGPGGTVALGYTSLFFSTKFSTFYSAVRVAVRGTPGGGSPGLSGADLSRDLFGYGTPVGKLLKTYPGGDRQLRAGTTVLFRLSAPATVRAVVKRVGCWRWRTEPFTFAPYQACLRLGSARREPTTTVWQGKAGLNRVVYLGRPTFVARGKYQMTLTATAAGASSKPTTLTFDFDR